MSSDDADLRHGLLKSVQRINTQLSLENDYLRARLGRLKQAAGSMKYHYADRILDELVLGDLQTKARFASDVASGVAGVASRAVRRAATLQERLLSRVLISPQTDAETVVALFEPTRSLKIALSLAGGLGDGVWLTAVAEAIRRKYLDSEIFIICSHPLYADVFRGNGAVKGVVLVEPERYSHFLRLLRSLLDKGLFDAWYECRYVTKVHYGRSSRIEAGDRAATDAAFVDCDVDFDAFPNGNNVTSTLSGARGENLFQLVGRSAQLDLDDPQLLLFPSFGDLRVTELVAPLGDYVTVHHGCDPKIRGGTVALQTKNWFKDRWEQVIAVLKAKNLRVVQLGTADETPLEGAIHAFMGRTSVQEVGVILKNALLHIDTEGGLVHLARAVHTRSVVLFGPTPIGFLGYPQNLNLRAGDCHDCWWSTSDWYQRCPRGLTTPDCMTAIDVPLVVDAVDQALEAARARPTCRLDDVALFAGDYIRTHEKLLRAIYAAAELEFHASHKHSMNDQSGAYLHGSKNWEYLYAVNQMARHFPEGRPLRILDAGSGRGALALYCASAGHSTHISDIDFAAHSHTGRPYETPFLQAIAGRVASRFGGIFNLPYEAEAFDVVFCISVVEHLQFKEHAFAELLRVLRPGGILVITYDLLADRSDEKGLTDWNRIDIFTEPKIAAVLERFGMSYPLQGAAVNRSCAAIQEFGIEGIPSGLTVGGMCIVKLQAGAVASEVEGGGKR